MENRLIVTSVVTNEPLLVPCVQNQPKTAIFYRKSVIFWNSKTVTFRICGFSVCRNINSQENLNAVKIEK